MSCAGQDRAVASALAVHVDAQRAARTSSSAQTSTRAIVERESRGHQPQPGGAPARRPVVRAAGTARRPWRRRAAARPGPAGSDVGVVRQPDGGVRREPGGRLTRSSSGSSEPPLRTRSGLAGGAEPVDPPVLRVAPPHPQVGAARRAAGRRRRTVEPVQRHVERALRVDLAGPAERPRTRWIRFGERGGADVAVVSAGRRAAAQAAPRTRARPAPPRASAPQGPCVLTVRRRAEPRAIGRWDYDQLPSATMAP